MTTVVNNNDETEGPRRHDYGASKTCTICRDTFEDPWDNFYPVPKPDVVYLSSYCQECHNQVSKDARDRRELREPGHRRREAIYRRYKMTEEDYDNLLSKQSGVCAICLESDSKFRDGDLFHIDHDHDTGKVRGLLCRPCNQGLGLFRDRKDSLAEAINYLNNPPAQEDA